MQKTSALGLRRASDRGVQSPMNLAFGLAPALNNMQTPDILSWDVAVCKGLIISEGVLVEALCCSRICIAELQLYLLAWIRAVKVFSSLASMSAQAFNKSDSLGVVTGSGYYQRCHTLARGSRS